MINNIKPVTTKTLFVIFIIWLMMYMFYYNYSLSMSNTLNETYKLSNDSANITDTSKSAKKEDTNDSTKKEDTNGTTEKDDTNDSTKKEDTNDSTEKVDTNDSTKKEDSIFMRPIDFYNGTEDYLIDTLGCYIPNYSKTLKFHEAKNKNQNCGERAVFVNKIDNENIIFHIDMEKLKRYNDGNINVTCCYQFAGRSSKPGKEDVQLKYSSCVNFQNGTTAIQEQEVVTVTCKSINKNKKTVYDDSYILLKKVNKTINKEANGKPWNVLILGMDTMSRARVYNSMPLTTKHMKQNNWLDFRGYNKVGPNTFPNLMSLLTGKYMSTVYKACKPTMSNCNELILWSKFQEAGFVTAYGEDFLRLPDTFGRYNGFITPPTDHYMRPFFLTGENIKGNLICTKKIPSAVHVLDYILQFSDAYKNEGFFGMFWLNSYSHNEYNTPTLFDKEIIKFLDKLEKTGALNNTFVLFMSDHGLRFGKIKVSIESYYEERLPMLFMWIPFEFRDLYAEEYYNLQLNQNRLTNAFNLHLTMWHIIKLSNSSVNIIQSEACPRCTSLLEEISLNRTCADASIDEKWCTCHEMAKVNRNDAKVTRGIELAVQYVRNRTKAIQPVPCMACHEFNFKTLYRGHSYMDKNNNKTYYVLAVLMSPGDVAYEIILGETQGKLQVSEPIQTITAYNSRGGCVRHPNDRIFCVCKKLNNCNKKHKKYI